MAGSVAAVLREALADARARGLDFEEAWEPAVKLTLAGVPAGRPRREWYETFSAMQKTWREAFELQGDGKLTLLGEAEETDRDGLALAGVIAA